jgi:hypothetical protein
MRCDVCSGSSDVFMVFGRDDECGDEEMNLCELCAAVAFPGLAEMMRYNCSLCDGPAAARWN